MIFFWLMKLIAKIKWLFVPPQARDVARIDPNAHCPGCNATSGTIRCVHRRKKDQQLAVLIEHTCSVCGARFFEDPVVGASPERLRPAMARTDIERDEDAEILLAQKNRAAEMSGDNPWQS